MGGVTIHPEGLHRAHAVAQWELGDPAWAWKIIRAYLFADDLGAAEAIAELGDDAED